MMNLEELPQSLSSYVNDYPIHFVNVREFEDTSVFKTDVKLVFDFMKYTKDRRGMRALLLENEDYKEVSRDAYEMMRIHTNLKEFDQLIGEKEQEEEVVDMCQAIREIIEEECALARERAIKEGREEGRKQGREEGIEQGIEEGIEQGIIQGILLQTYRMVERGKMSVEEALEDIELNLTEGDFIEGMLAAGYRIPQAVSD